MDPESAQGPNSRLLLVASGSPLRPAGPGPNPAGQCECALLPRLIPACVQQNPMPRR